MQPFIYYVLAFICNARQLISTCQIIYFYFKHPKILFLKISFFENFVSLFDFIFFKKKKFPEFYCSQLIVDRLLFTDYCSMITVHDLSCNTIIVLQYNSQQPPILQYTGCPAIQFPAYLQYNSNLAIQLLLSLSHNTI